MCCIYICVVINCNFFKKYLCFFDLCVYLTKMSDSDEAAPPTDDEKVITTDIPYVSKQVGGTCFAHATATAILEAIKISKGLSIGLHKLIVKSIVAKFGHHGGDFIKVLNYQINLNPELHYKVLKPTAVEDVKRCITNDHCVMASFHLTHDEWQNFYHFFDAFDNTWVMDKCDIDKIKCGTHDVIKDKKIKKTGSNKKTGHAVVIVGFGILKQKTEKSEYMVYWKIKNSWGKNYGDHGYFRAFPDAIGFYRYAPVWYQK